MRTRLGIAAALMVTLAACGTPSPGQDFAGNQATAASRAASEPTTDDPAETTTEDSNAEQPSSAGAPTLKLGEAATVSMEMDHSSGLITVSSPKVWQRPTSTELGHKPRNGRFLRVTVAASSTGGVFGVNPEEFVVIDADGNRYRQGEDSAAEEVDDATFLHVVDLNPGEKARGTIVYDVPRGNLTLAYAPFDQTLATWELTVK